VAPIPPSLNDQTGAPAGTGSAEFAAPAPNSALGPRALRDIKRGLDQGRFEFDSPQAALSITGGALLGTMQGVADGALGDGADVVHAAAILRMLGVPQEDAARTARLAMAAP
jgi:hypothetical protein